MNKLGEPYSVTPVGISRNTLINLLSKECGKKPANDNAGRILISNATSFLSAVEVEPEKPILCRFSGRTNSAYH